MNQFKSFANSMSPILLNLVQRLLLWLMLGNVLKLQLCAAFACKHKPTSLVCSEKKILIKIKPKLVKLKFSA